MNNWIQIFCRAFVARKSIIVKQCHSEICKHTMWFWNFLIFKLGNPLFPIRWPIYKLRYIDFHLLTSAEICYDISVLHIFLSSAKLSTLRSNIFHLPQGSNCQKISNLTKNDHFAPFKVIDLIMVLCFLSSLESPIKRLKQMCLEMIRGQFTMPWRKGNRIKAVY